eukprot:Tbor_TRINITY_DN1864_c0_g1::TRINITY_DN1864_c0_g1_i1::g.23093::m.23093
MSKLSVEPSKQGANCKKGIVYGKIEPHSLIISVSDPIMYEGEVHYKISIMDPLRPRVAIHTVSRTYLDLKPILKKLSDIDKSVNLPPVKKVKIKLFGSLKEPFEESRASIEQNLNAICKNRLLNYDVDFLNFVGYQEAANERMARCALLTELAGTPTLHGFFSILKNSETVKPEVEAHLIAARCWLRSKDNFIFIRALDCLTHPNWYTCKVNILVEDARRKPYILTVQTIKESVSYFGSSMQTDSVSLPERVKRVKELLCDNVRINGVLAPLTVLEVCEGRMYAIRELYSMGSLYDYIYNVSDPLSSGSVKYKDDTKRLPFPLLQKLCQSVFHIVKSCHAFDIPTTNLTMGNLLVVVDPVTGNPRCLLGGLEDVLAGNGWLPFKPPSSYEGSMVHSSTTDEIQFNQVVDSPDGPVVRRTNIDILLFGTIMFQCTYECALAAEGLESLLQVQGDPFISKATELPDNIVIAQTSHVLSNIQELKGNTPSLIDNGVSPTGLKSVNYLREAPSEVFNLLHYIFHPIIPVDERVLAHHSFLWVDAPAPTDNTNYRSPSMEIALQLKKRELNIFFEMTRLWEKECDHNRLRREKAERIWNQMRAGGQSMPLVDLSNDNRKQRISGRTKCRESKTKEKKR